MTGSISPAFGCVQQFFPFLARQTAFVEICSRPFTPMVEKTLVVILRLQRGNSERVEHEADDAQPQATTPPRTGGRYGSPPSSTVFNTSAHFFPHGLNLFAANPSRHVCRASSRWPLNQ